MTGVANVFVPLVRPEFAGRVAVPSVESKCTVPAYETTVLPASITGGDGERGQDPERAEVAGGQGDRQPAAPPRRG